MAGINVDTLFAWSRSFPDFSDRLEKADAQCERSHVRNVSKAGRKPKHWTASAWLLERKFPQRYGKVERHVVDSIKPTMALPQQYMEAISRALLGNSFRPLRNGIEVDPVEWEQQKQQQGQGPNGRPDVVKKPVALLPAPRDGSSEDEKADPDDGLPILP